MNHRRVRRALAVQCELLIILQTPRIIQGKRKKCQKNACYQHLTSFGALAGSDAASQLFVQGARIDSDQRVIAFTRA
jgi:hypothetical protein